MANEHTYHARLIEVRECNQEAWSPPEGFGPFTPFVDAGGQWFRPTTFLFPAAPWPAPGGPFEVITFKDGHDGTMMFTWGAMGALVGMVAEQLARHPGWGVHYLGMKSTYVEDMPLKCGGKYPGTWDEYLAILAPTGSTLPDDPPFRMPEPEPEPEPSADNHWGYLTFDATTGADPLMVPSSVRYPGRPVAGKDAPTVVVDFNF